MNVRPPDKRGIEYRVRCYGKSMNEPGGIKSKGTINMMELLRKLQIFADEGAEGGADDAGASAAEDQEGTQGDKNGSGEGEPGQEQEKKYTDKDLDRIIAKKIAAERKRMTKLFNDDQQESDLDKRERDVLRRELRADAKERLASEGLPVARPGINKGYKVYFEQYISANTIRHVGIESFQRTGYSEVERAVLGW